MFLDNGTNGIVRSSGILILPARYTEQFGNDRQILDGLRPANRHLVKAQYLGNNFQCPDFVTWDHFPPRFCKTNNL